MSQRLLIGLLALSAVAVQGADVSGKALDREFTETVQPFVTKYCAMCHSGQKPAAQFDLKAYTTRDMVVQDYPHWALVESRLTADEMPPKGLPQPSEADRKHIIDWIEAVRSDEARKNDGDPGLVLARRLSNAEYDYTIRDLTGVNLRPAREFPLDPSNQAGFDNSGESLTMSPSLLKKYLQAARDVGDHVVLTPDGIAFAPFPMLVETDREKYAIQRIVNFYLSQPTDFADYFAAAWRYKHRTALHKPNATLAAAASEAKVSPKYLQTVWQLLEEPAAKTKLEVGPIAKLQTMWRGLPEPGTADVDQQLRTQTIAMRDFVVKIRAHTAMQFTAPLVEGLSGAAQPLLNWKLGEFAAHHRDSDPKDLRNDTDPAPVVPVIPGYPDLHEEAGPRWAALSAKARANDTDLIVPAHERARYQASFERFANVFPDAFYIKERGRYFPDDSEDKGRLLSAGFHNVMGYYRDDTALRELILDDKGTKDLQRLWDEFDFIGRYTQRTWTQFFMNESGEVLGNGAESGSPRPTDHAVTDTPVIFHLMNQYLELAAMGPENDPEAPAAIREHFNHVNITLRALEKMHTAAEPKHITALLDFAARAYRRPLTKAERDDIVAFYHELRKKNELTHEDAIRDSVVSILMSPDFLYRVDLVENASRQSGTALKNAAMTAGSDTAIRPLTNYELASRLSYFLWSSMPDAELLRHAAAGDLRKPEVLRAETQRMLEDKRVYDLASEFGGNWLDFRHFENYNSVDRQRFPMFDNDLREAMFEEPIHFIDDSIRNNRSLLDMLYGNYTFVNPVLAKHYRIPVAATAKPDEWVRVDNAAQYDRGGLLPMSVFLTNTSPGLRTSPVKRGFWIVHRLLGETIPPPPAVVPELPSDESKSNLSLRDALAQHRVNPLCSGCHAKFDVFGLALEGYGPVGEAREKDLGGRPVDTTATLPGGIDAKGVEGIRSFIRDHREHEFVDGVTRKFVAYALSRSLQLSDDLLIDRIEASLAAKQNRFDVLVDSIVNSPQFLNKRVASPVTRNVEARPVAQVRSGVH